MTDEPAGSAMTRRQLLSMIGSTAGGTAMYQAMSSLGLAAESPFKAPSRLTGAPAGASVLVLGAGIAGMVAAYELRNAGYRVQVLEYNDRAGGRNWTLRGGDRYTELGGVTQECRFDPGLYINPGPWRLPYHHRGMLHYCKRLGVPLEAFVQVNHNAYLHASNAFGGKPQRFRSVKADYQGHIAELLAKATQSQKLDAPVTRKIGRSCWARCAGARSTRIMPTQRASTAAIGAASNMIRAAGSAHGRNLPSRSA